MKIYFIQILLVVLMSISFVSFAQRSCGVEYNLEKLEKSDPNEYKRIVDLEEFVKNNTSNSQQRIIDPNGKIIIPVVVHVLHGGAAVGTFDNISNAQVFSQIDVLNEDYRRLNADRVNTPVPFQSVAVDVNIEFRLACIDPNGNPTTLFPLFV